MNVVPAAEWAGRHFDGRTPRPREARVRVEPGAVLMASEGEPERRWPMESVTIVREGRGRDPVQLELRGENVESLLVADPGFLVALREASGGRLPARAGTTSFGLRRALVLALAGIAFLFLAWRWAVPALAALAADHVPAAWERELGAMALHDLAPPAERVTDERIVGPVRDVFARIERAVARRDSFDVVVLRSRVVNAFALPGGHVVVTTGLLDVLQGPDELAAVLAHEIAHLVRRHTVRGLLERQGFRTLTGLVGGNPSGLGSMLGAAGTLGELSYSRDDEQEADDGAAELLVHAGISPQALARALESMSRREGDGGAGLDLGFLSTHPATPARIRRIRSLTGRASMPLDTTALNHSEWSALQEALPTTSVSAPGR